MKRHRPDIPPKLWERLKARALKNRRTPTAELEVILEKELQN